MKQVRKQMSRRAFLETFAEDAAKFLILAGNVPGLAGNIPSPKRPNIVLIMADDLGFSDLGCYGSEIPTPNLDKLAATGLRFTHFYNTARCCPTRAALLSGLYPHQAGVGDMVRDLGNPAYQGHLNEQCVTIAEALRQGAYHTLMSGKWHVGEERPHWPFDRGFDRTFGLVGGASNYFRLDPDRKLALDDKAFVPEGDRFYMTDAFTEHAVRFLNEYGRKPEPFFLYLAYTAPHWPLHALPEDIAAYRGKYMDGWDSLRVRRHRRMIEMGIVEAKWRLTPRDREAPAWAPVKEKDTWDLKMAVYAAQIDRMDQGIGRVLDKIKELGAEENSLVMFLSDNGGCHEEINRGKPGIPPGQADSYLSYGLPWANVSNTPFRLYKHWVHEGGIATPLIVHWPAVIKRGDITLQVGHVIDIMASCLEVGGAEYPRRFNGRTITLLEGKSLMPIFKGLRREGHEAIFWEHEGNRAVRHGKWKLVSRFPDRWELYDLEADRTEMHNLAGKYPGKAKQLIEMYEGWARRCGVVPWQELKRKRRKQPSKDVI